VIRWWCVKKEIIIIKKKKSRGKLRELGYFSGHFFLLGKEIRWRLHRAGIGQN